MSAIAFDHPFLSGLLGDEETAAYFSAEADIRAMLQFEAALARAQAAHDIIPLAAAETISAACASFAPDIGSLRTATARDGVVTQLRMVRSNVLELQQLHRELSRSPTR